MNINLNLIVRLKQLDVNNFNEKTNKRYYELRNSYLSTQNLIQRYNTYYELIKNSGAALREEQKWSKDSDVNGEDINFEKEIEYINDWIIRHMTYLDKNVFPIDTKINNPYYNITDKHIIYNLKGQRIEKQARDIYIQNRRKFLVR